jgi:hypothetical protein
MKKITIKFETQMATKDEPFWSIVADCYSEGKLVDEWPYYVVTGSQDEIDGCRNDTAINDAKPKVLAWAKENWPEAEIEFA